MSTAREWDLKRYCKEYQKIENYEKAISSSEVYDLHHRLEFTPFSGKRISSKMLKELGLYYNQEPEAFIFLSHSEHTTLHQLGKDRSNVSKKTRKQISNSLEMNPNSRANRAKLLAKKWREDSEGLSWNEFQKIHRGDWK